MKKCIAIVLALVLCLSLSACGLSSGSGQTGQQGGAAPTQAVGSTVQATAQPTATASPTAEPEKTVITDGSMLGVLQPVAEQDSLVIRGLYLTSGSGQHKYEHVDDVGAFGTDGLNSEYEQNEWIAFYVDAESALPISIYVAPNDAGRDYSGITAPEIAITCADMGYPIIPDAVPDAENRGYLGENYVHPEAAAPGLFNVFFVSGGNVCYMVQLDIIAENTAG